MMEPWEMYEEQIARLKLQYDAEHREYMAELRRNTELSRNGLIVSLCAIALICIRQVTGADWLWPFIWMLIFCSWGFIIASMVRGYRLRRRDDYHQRFLSKVIAVSKEWTYD